MPTNSSPYPSEERLLAGLSHLMGWLVALIILAVEQGKSKFVRFQAVQSILFSLTMTAVYTITVSCMMMLIFGGMAVGIVSAGLAENSASEPGIGIYLAGLSMMSFWMLAPCLAVAALCAFIVRLIAAVSAFTGKEFRYPVLAGWADRFLGK
jgi:uncharacterized membrane protein